MTPPIKTHGGPNRGQGRKPQGEKKPCTILIRVTEAQQATYRANDGAKLVREMLDKLQKVE